MARSWQRQRRRTRRLARYGGMVLLAASGAVLITLVVWGLLVLLRIVELRG